MRLGEETETLGGGRTEPPTRDELIGALRRLVHFLDGEPGVVVLPRPVREARELLEREDRG